MNELQEYYTLYQGQSFLLPNPENFLSRIPLTPLGNANVSLRDSYNDYVNGKFSTPGEQNFTGYLLQAVHFLGPRSLTHFILTDFEYWGFLYISKCDSRKGLVQIEGTWLRPERHEPNASLTSDRQLVVNCKKFVQNLYKERQCKGRFDPDLIRQMLKLAQASHHDTCLQLSQYED